MSGINQVVRQLRAQRKRTERELEKLNLAIKALSSLDDISSSTRGVIRRKPKFSAAARAKIGAAQRARWAKLKAAQKK